ncbi:MAG: hypothetical protein WC332_00965 [Clostridia bacterium]|jgi:hypothetical protein
MNKADILREEAGMLLKQLIPGGGVKIDRIVTCIMLAAEMEIIEKFKSKMMKRGSDESE